jgi:hypothetical protein
LEKKLDARISQIHVLVQIWSMKLAISEGMKWIMYAMDHENSMTLWSSMWFRV